VVTTAGVILIGVGAFAAVAAALILSSGDRAAIRGLAENAVQAVGWAALIVGVVEVLAGTLILRLSQVGRVLGIVLGAVGVLGALASLASPQGLISIAIYGFVIYALAPSGDAFRHQGQG
jgi:hypothetical protein